MQHEVKKVKVIKDEQEQKEQYFMNQQLQVQHTISNLENKCDQLERSLSTSQSNS